MDTNQRNETASWVDSAPQRLWAAPSPGTILGGRFLLLAELGRGGSGTVFAARDTRLDTKVALKVIHPHLADPASRERLRREVRSARAKHPNAAAVYDLHEDGRLVFLTMELVEGETLRDRLLRERALPLADVLGIAEGMAAALAHLHQAGLVHRDVKPGNILLAPDGRAVLCDMGLVRSLEDDLTLTATNFTMGTPAYMAPEQATRTGLSPATDVYALGLTLYQCLTGVLPNAGDSTVATLMARQRARPPRLRGDRPDVPRWLERLVRWMLEPRPEDRPTAGQVAWALDSGRVGPRVTRRDVHAAAAALAVVAALGGLAWAVQRTAPPEAARVEAAGREVRGYDERGQVVWRVAVRGVVNQTERLDVDLDGHEETLVVAEVDAIRPDRAAMAGEGEILAIRDDGGLALRTTLADLAAPILTREFPFHLSASGFLHDVDRDGTTELVVSLRQHAFYPSGITIFWPRLQRWMPVLAHSGWILDIEMPPDEPPRLQFLAAANLQGQLIAVGEVLIAPPRADIAPIADGGIGPPEQGIGSSETVSWSFYTLLPSDSGDGALPNLDVGDGWSRYSFGQARATIDRWGNPSDSPNAGRDLRRERMQLQSGLADLRASGPTVDGRSPREVQAALDNMESRHEDLLREPALRVAFEITAARALARAGRPSAGTERLRRTAANWPWQDVLYRLAHLEAVSGNPADAVRTLERLIGQGRGSRAQFDGPHLLLRLAIERQNAEETARQIAALQSQWDRVQRASVAGPLWARARLWWSTPTPADTTTMAANFAPAGGAIACLVRWRLGQLQPDDPAAMRRYAEDNPDARSEAWLAEGAAQLGLGDATGALVTLDGLVNTLAPLARDDFANLQVLQLARAVRLLALAESGHPAEAARQARALRPELTDGLLPAVLLDELLAGSAGAVPSREARLAPIAAP